MTRMKTQRIKNQGKHAKQNQITPQESGTPWLYRLPLGLLQIMRSILQLVNWHNHCSRCLDWRISGNSFGGDSDASSSCAADAPLRVHRHRQTRSPLQSSSPSVPAPLCHRAPAALLHPSQIIAAASVQARSPKPPPDRRPRKSLHPPPNQR